MKHFVSAAILLSVAAYCGQVHSGGQAAMPPGNPMLGQLGEMGGAAEAAVEECGLGDDTEQAKRQQREQFIRMGGTREQFEAAYQAGYDRAKSEYAAAGPAERQRMCAEYKQLGSAGAGLGR